MHRLCFLLLRRMGDVFMFAAQPENVTTDDGKEQPPDFTNIAKRARSQEAEERFPLQKTTTESFKSKLLSASSPDSWKGFGTGNRYGNQWIADGKRNGFQGIVGKTGSSAKQSFETQTIREDKNRQNLEHPRSLDSVGPVKQVTRSASVTKNDILKLKKVHGSRFTVLNDTIDVDEADEELQEQSGSQFVNNSPKVLVEISNKSSIDRRHVTTSVTKYLVDTIVVKSVSKSSKMNSMVKGSKTQGRGGKKIYRQTKVVQVVRFVEEPDDYAVLQSLHKNIVESEKVGDQGAESSLLTVIDIDQQADVTGSVNFDSVASSLKEAMTMTLE
ncbi:hypothetical protein LWI28_021427 [Acer negundo]|uniref:Uncharacterized protein n=1 Tax=Acer negundo TaxID=4023 RepID=A0AAD5I6Z0_ACENE|nr:hypothetical protein LWI28_021427 [Acer negundo]